MFKRMNFGVNVLSDLDMGGGGGVKAPLSSLVAPLTAFYSFVHFHSFKMHKKEPKLALKKVILPPDLKL